MGMGLAVKKLLDTEKKVRFSVTLNMSSGNVDLELLEANFNAWMQRAVDESTLSSDDDDAAAIVDIDVLPHGFVE